MSILATATEQNPQDQPESLYEVLQEWGDGWIWQSLKLVGEEDWLYDAIRLGTCTAVTEGSFIKELYPDLCSCAFILECTEGRGRIYGSFLEQSDVACAYRGELLGLMAIHLLLLAADKRWPDLTGLVKIYSDCLGALMKVTHLPERRLPAGIKHSDILKNIVVNCSKLSFDCKYLHVRAHQDDQRDYH